MKATKKGNRKKKLRPNWHWHFFDFFKLGGFKAERVELTSQESERCIIFLQNSNNLKFLSASFSKGIFFFQKKKENGGLKGTSPSQILHFFTKQKGMVPEKKDLSLLHRHVDSLISFSPGGSLATETLHRQRSCTYKPENEPRVRTHPRQNSADVDFSENTQEDPRAQGLGVQPASTAWTPPRRSAATGPQSAQITQQLSLLSTDLCRWLTLQHIISFKPHRRPQWGRCHYTHCMKWKLRLRGQGNRAEPVPG